MIGISRAAEPRDRLPNHLTGYSHVAHVGLHRDGLPASRFNRRDGLGALRPQPPVGDRADPLEDAETTATYPSSLLIAILPVQLVPHVRCARAGSRCSRVLQGYRTSPDPAG